MKKLDWMMLDRQSDGFTLKKVMAKKLTEHGFDMSKPVEITLDFKTEEMIFRQETSIEASA